MATPTKMEKVLNKAEAAIDAKAEATRAELIDIADTLPALRQAVQDAEDDAGPASEVWDRINDGEDVPPADLIGAEYQEKIDKGRLDALTKRKGALERSLPVETLVLAEEAANALRTVMQGFDVHVTRADSRTWAFPEDTTAIVVVADPRIERNPYTGLVSGNVKVLMHRPGHFRPINVEVFEAAAKAERLNLSVTSNDIGDEGGWQTLAGVGAKPKDPNAFVTDSLTVRLDGVIDQHAVIAKVDLSGLHSRVWVEEVYRSNGSNPSGVVGADREWLWGVTIGRHTVATGHPAEVVSEIVDERGIRTLVVRQKINTHRTHPGDFGLGLGEAMRLDHGQTYLGLGALVDSSIEAGAINHRDQDANWTIVLTFESKVA